MKNQIQLILINLLLFNCFAFAQTVELEGYVFEDNNRGFLNEVEVNIYDAGTESFVTKSISNSEGLFIAQLPAGKDYILKVSKNLFYPKEAMASTKGKSTGEKAYAKVKMERKPGYIFDVTLAEKGDPKATVDAISGARIEVFNNTKMEEILVIESLKGINFDVTFERGNHYTVLIRKDGFFNKRLEAYVDVEDCILCFEGVGTVTPGVSDVMSEGFQVGSVLANIELEPARLNRTIEVENIYYDLNKSFIRSDAAVELDKVVKLLKDNPTIIIELGSHTDSRGGTRHNMQLSSRRATSAVNYIVDKGGIDRSRISAKGYGETKLVNNCTDGVKCSEEEHQNNRRTELKIVGFKEVDPLAGRSLSEMLIEEKLLNEVLNSEQIQVKPGEKLPDLDSKSKNTNNPPIPEATSKSKSSNNGKTLDKSLQTEVEKMKTTSTPNPNTQNTPQIISVKPVSESTSNKSTTATNDQKSNLPTQNAKTTNNSNWQRSSEVASNTSNSANFPEFSEDKIMLVQEGQIKFLNKMIGNQLNTQVTDLLMSETIFLQKEKGLMTYKFDSLDKMPIELLDAFRHKLAMVKKNNGWQIYQMLKGQPIPAGLVNALK